jgi:uncharacterized integral membrane protein
MAAADPTREPASGKDDRKWRSYLAGAIALLALIFVLQNTDETRVKFLFAETELPLFFALVISIALGAAIGWLAPRVRRGSRRD